MTINRAATAGKSTQPAKAFTGATLNGARRGVMRGRKEQITLTIAPALLTKIDEIASKIGQSRAVPANLAIYELAERVSA